MATSKVKRPDPSRKIPYDDFVRSIRPDPKKVEPLVLLQGYAGDSSEKGHFRLYTDEALNHFVDLPNDAVIYCEKNSKEENSRGGCKVWVKQNTVYTYGNPTQPNRPKANFLEGDIMSNFRGGAGYIPNPNGPVTIVTRPCFGRTPIPCLTATPFGGTRCKWRTPEFECKYNTELPNITDTCNANTITTCQANSATEFGPITTTVEEYICPNFTMDYCDNITTATQIAPRVAHYQTVAAAQNRFRARGGVYMPTPTEPVWTPTSPVIRTGINNGIVRNTIATFYQRFNPYTGY